MFHFVYKTTNLVNGRYYIGKTTTKYLNKKYFGSGKILLEAIKKYGEENFKREILAYSDTPEANAEKERELIGDLWSTDPLCYNLKAGGLGGRPKGLALSEETRSKISGALKGKTKSASHVANIKKRVFSEETKRRMSEAAKNRPPRTEEHKRKLGLVNKGRHLSEEHKRKVSEGVKRHWA